MKLPKDYFEKIWLGGLNPLTDAVPPIRYWLESNQLADDLRSCVEAFRDDHNLQRKIQRVGASPDRIVYLLLSYLHPRSRETFDAEVTRVRKKFSSSETRKKIRDAFKSIKAVFPDLREAQFWCEVNRNYEGFFIPVKMVSMPYERVIKGLAGIEPDIDFILDDLRYLRDHPSHDRGRPSHRYIWLQSHLQRLLTVKQPKAKKTAHAALISEIFSRFGIERSPQNIIRDLKIYSFL